MTRHPSMRDQPDLDWERYEAELRTPDRCTWLHTAVVAAVVVTLTVVSWLPIAVFVWWVRK